MMALYLGHALCLGHDALRPELPPLKNTAGQRKTGIWRGDKCLGNIKLFFRKIRKNMRRQEVNNYI